MRRTFIAAGCLLLAGLHLPAGAVERLSLSHVRQLADSPPRLRVYLDALDDADQPMQGLTEAEVTATLGRERAVVQRVEPFVTSGEGIATIFLVDISRSLTAEQFDGIRDALEAWIRDFQPRDWGAVVAFGDTSEVVVDFTSDRDEMLAGLEALAPTAGQTLFHQALDDAFELSRRQDGGMPGRRVAVVLTDGYDEGSALALEDVLARLRETPVPIHAIGYSRLRPESRRQEYLEVLRRLATNSGGSFFEARQTDFAESYAAIREAIRRVWVVDVSCPTCAADGSVQRLQLHLNRDGRVLSRGADIRLLPMIAPSPQPGPQEAEQATAPGAAAGNPGEPAAADRSWWQAVPWWVYALTVLLLGLLGVLVAGFTGRGEETAAAGETSAEEPAPAEAPPTATPPAEDPSLRQMPAIPSELAATLPSRPRNLRLVVLRGSRKGKEYRLTLEEKAVIGSRSTCDCVLSDEPGIAAEQFELSQNDGQVLVRNLAGQNPTLMAGRPVLTPQRLRSNDLIGTREVILRAIFEG